LTNTIRQHGDRSTYLRGCRCFACREANRLYAIKQRTGATSLVRATRARHHLQNLARQGVGSQAAADAADVARFTIRRIRSGKSKKITRQSERRILALTKDAVADRGLIDRRSVDQMLLELIEAGFTPRQLALNFGYTNPVLQFNGQRVQARTKMKVEKFYNRVMAEVAA
jgi:hypothetical protein